VKMANAGICGAVGSILVPGVRTLMIDCTCVNLWLRVSGTLRCGLEKAA